MAGFADNMLGSDQQRRMKRAEGEQSRIQTEDANRAAQDRLVQEEATRNQLNNQRTANDVAMQMLGNQDNPRTSTGLEFQVSSPGGGGGGVRSSGGMSIGGGVYPNVSQLMKQFKSNLPKQVSPPPRVAPPVVPDQSSGFAQAKDVSGRLGNKALESLRNMMTQRGISDSGLAGEGEANILGNVARQQADAEYEAGRTNTARQFEANQLGYQGDLSQNAMGYQGAIGQRNNDLQLLLSMLSRIY